MVGFGRRRRTQRVRSSDIEWLEGLDPSPAFAEEPAAPRIFNSVYKVCDLLVKRTACDHPLMYQHERNCSPHIIRQTINVSSIGRRLDTKLHEQMKICVNSMLCLMARPQIHLPNVKTCLDVVNTYAECAPQGNRLHGRAGPSAHPNHHRCDSYPCGSLISI